MRRVILCALALSVAACSDSTSPDGRGLKAGRYSITSSSQAGSGVLTLTDVSSARVKGSWNIKQNSPGTGTMAGATEGGYFNDGAYEVYGTLNWGVGATQFQTVFNFRLAANGSNYSCTVEESTLPDTRQQCTMTYLGQ